MAEPEEIPEEHKGTYQALTSRAPVDGSEQLQRYLREHRRTVRYVFFITGIVTRADEVALAAAKVLLGVEPSHVDAERYKRLIERGAGNVKFLQRNRDVFIETAVCRAVDNYLCFVSELLQAIFIARPEALRSSEQERLDFVLKHTSMESLVAAIAEKRVHQLSYQGMEAIAEYFSTRLGLDMFGSDEDRTTTIDVIQKRNLIVHNRGFANTIYLTKGFTGLAVGEKVNFTPDEFFGLLKKLCDAAIHVDNRATEKFALPIIRPERTLDLEDEAPLGDTVGKPASA